ncbi:MAG: hypothetical protein FJX63_00865 [Alphaproteobacteria bacterium]|nr:hypothetical protein [Alphaproteobacteria bacterium]
MGTLRAADIDRLLAKGRPDFRIMLVAGQDHGEVHRLAERLTKAAATGEVTVTILSEADLGKDTARLVDEVMSSDLFGGAKAILVRDADRNFLAAAELVLASAQAGHLVVAEAPPLAKSHKLRLLCEKDGRCAYLPVYERSEAEAAAWLATEMGRRGLSIGRDAAMRLVEIVGAAASILLREAEKLETYAGTAKSVTIADVEALCGQGGEGEANALLDSAFAGRDMDVERLMRRLFAEGWKGAGIALAAHGHAVRLLDTSLAVAAGASLKTVLESARPQIFFKRHDLWALQLRLWKTEQLTALSTALNTTVYECRTEPEIADAAISRALLNIANQAKGRAARLSS